MLLTLLGMGWCLLHWICLDWPAPPNGGSSGLQSQEDCCLCQGPSHTLPGSAVNPGIICIRPLEALVGTEPAGRDTQVPIALPKRILCFLVVAPGIYQTL